MVLDDHRPRPAAGNIKRLAQAPVSLINTCFPLKPDETIDLLTVIDRRNWVTKRRENNRSALRTPSTIRELIANEGDSLSELLPTMAQSPFPSVAEEGRITLDPSAVHSIGSLRLRHSNPCFESVATSIGSPTECLA